MSCYHPLVGISVGVTENGKKHIVIKPKYLEEHSYEELKKNNGILLPCGHCIGCRLDYSRSWADRMMLELDIQKKAIFLTLTYDNEHAPWKQFYDDGTPMFASLDKIDCQLFMKRLRRHFEDKKIRFYLAGEYGSKTCRPHYHAIIYGLSLYDFTDLYSVGRNELGQQYYSSKILEEIWNNGFILVADVSWSAMAYVSRYVTKKLSGDKAISYAERNVIPEFSLMSRKPGIGAQYLEEHPDCLDYQNINLSAPEGGIKIRIPQYYLRKLELTDPEKADRIKEERRRAADDSMMIQLQKTDLSLLEYLEVKEENRKSKIRKLKRK